MSKFKSHDFLNAFIITMLLHIGLILSFDKFFNYSTLKYDVVNNTHNIIKIKLENVLLKQENLENNKEPTKTIQKQINNLKREIVKEVPKIEPKKSEPVKNIVKTIDTKPKQDPIFEQKTLTENVVTEVKEQMPNIEHIKEKFFYELRRKIEENKVYPRNARERGIEDNCKVSFNLLQNGSISNLEIKGKNVFKNSIEKCLEKCFPVSVPTELKEFPLVISFTLAYKLD